MRVYSGSGGRSKPWDVMLENAMVATMGGVGAMSSFYDGRDKIGDVALRPALSPRELMSVAMAVQSTNWQFEICLGVLLWTEMRTLKECKKRRLIINER